MGKDLDPLDNPKMIVAWDTQNKRKVALNVSKAQKWELEEYGGDYDGMDEYYRTLVKPVLYRQPSGAWILVEKHTNQMISGATPEILYKQLTALEAAERLLQSGFDPPADIAHYVDSNCLIGPDLAPVVEQPATGSNGEGAADGDSEIKDDLWNVLFPPKTGKFEPECYGPVREPTDLDGDGVPGFYMEETLFRYSENRWVLVWKQTHVESEKVWNKGHRPVIATEAADWILNHGLQLPESMYAHLPSPPEADLSPSTTANKDGAELTHLSTTPQKADGRNAPDNNRYLPLFEDEKYVGSFDPNAQGVKLLASRPWCRSDEMPCLFTNNERLSMELRCDAFLYFEPEGGRFVLVEDLEDDLASPPFPQSSVITPQSALAWLLRSGLAVPRNAEHLFRGVRPDEGPAAAARPAEQPVGAGAIPRGNSRISRKEANWKARDYLLRNKHREGSAKPVSVRELAGAIPCSTGLVATLPAWKAVQEQREKPAKVKTVSLTDKMLADTGQGEKDEVLNRLIDEQRCDFEPSPLDNNPPAEPQRRVKVRKKL